MAQPVAIIADADAASAALSHVRRAVLAALRRPGSATTVGHELGLPRQKVNYHVRALEAAGLLEHVEDRPRAGCTERIVRATATHYLIDSSVLGELGTPPEDAADLFSAENLAAVSARTVRDLGKLTSEAAAVGKRLSTFSLETAVRFSSPADQTAFLERLSNAVAALVSEYHDEPAPDGRWFRLTVGSHPALPRRGPAERADAEREP